MLQTQSTGPEVRRNLFRELKVLRCGRMRKEWWETGSRGGHGPDPPTPTPGLSSSCGEFGNEEGRECEGFSGF